MSDIKKYYYLKLKENFYDTDEIKILEGMPNGYKYSNILLKLYLRSLKNNGALRLNEYIPYNAEMIATLTGHDVDTVRVALDIFKKLKLVEVLEDGTMYMLQIQNFIGESSTEADRKRIYRAKIEEEKQITDNEKDICPEAVPEASDKNPPEIEIESESEIESDNIYSADQSPVNNVDNVDEPNNKQMPYNEIVDYLNLKAGTSYRSTSSKTKILIKARYNEKFTIDDFKTVIDKKVLEWKGTEFEKFLRPETLFGPKFESYLNQPEDKNNKSSGDTAVDYDGHPYSRQKMQNICDQLLGRKAEEG